MPQCDKIYATCQTSGCKNAGRKTLMERRYFKPKMVRRLENDEASAAQVYGPYFCKLCQRQAKVEHVVGEC